MTLHVAVDLTSGTPPYEQIRAQVAGHVSAGSLRTGDRLPTVRDLAADLGVAVGTVQRAYRELESQGVVTTRRRAGTTVTARVGEAAVPEVRAAARRLVRQARGAGMGDAEILDLVRGTLLGPAEDDR